MTSKGNLPALSRVVGLSSLVLAFCLAAPPAKSGPTTVTATVTNGQDFDFLAATGSFGVRAYSEQNGAKNATVTPTVVVGGAPVAPIAGPMFGASAPPFPAYYIGAGPPVRVPTGMLSPANNLNGKRNPIYTNLGPTATLLVNSDSGGGGGPRGPNQFNKTRWLPAAGDEVTVTSVTGQYTGEGSASNIGGVRVLSASADAGALPPPPGAAAGFAFDPFFISSSSSLAYAPRLNATLNANAPGVAAGALYWATDSSVFTSDDVYNFTADGAPLDKTLWYLAIDDSGAINSLSDVNVDFVLNPAALNEILFPSSFLAGLGPFSNPATEAALIDAAIDQDVMSALSLSSGALSLSPNFDPFPNGTMFSPVSGGVTYGDGVEAAVEAPEPGTGWLLLPAMALAFTVRRPARAAFLSSTQHSGTAGDGMENAEKLRDQDRSVIHARRKTREASSSIASGAATACTG